MHRSLSITLLGALAALVAAAPAGAAAPVIKTITKHVPIRQGHVTETKVGCPSPMVAVAGTVLSQPKGSTFDRSLPSAARIWRFAFGGHAGASKHKATVQVRCLGLSVPSAAGKVNLNVNTVSRGQGVGALGTARLTINCRAGYVPTDWGFKMPSPADEVQVFEALATRRGYSFGLENVGASSRVVRLRVRCLQRSVAGRAGLAHSWRIKSVRHSQRIRSGVRTVRHSCPQGYMSIGPGHSIDPADDMLFRRSYDVRFGSGAWRFDNPRGVDRVKTELLCLNTGTRFH